MDFFEAQDRAKRRTARLVALFALAVLGTIALAYGAALLLFRQLEPRAAHFRQGYDTYQRTATWPADRALTQWWDPRLLAGVAAGTLLLVGLASLYKWSQLRAGGAAIATLVGGRPVDPRTTDLRERRLLNIVEEMAIAAGLPAPAVFVLPGEPALNAFAAGLTPGDAVVAVTQGTLDKLSRDELQAVVGHEFSHILNGDMRLNARLAALVFGLLFLGLLGRGILHSLGRGRVRVGGGKKGGGGLALILAAGVALMVIGYLGYFFGRLIQAAVSRQREFLADASAVQFTRNPAGLTGALAKIGGYALGSSLVHRQAAELGHFYFAQGFRSFLGGLWATHPPLPERIRAVDPRWDGRFFAPPEVVDVTTESFASAGFARAAAPPSPPAAALAASPPPPPPRARLAFAPAAVVATTGTLTERHCQQAQALLAHVPSRLREAARDAALAPALVYGLLLPADAAGREQAQALVARHAGPEAADALRQLRPALSLLDPAARLPLLQLTLPALRPLAGAALERLAATLDELVHADHRVTPFEFALQKILLRNLRLARQPATRIDHHSFAAVADAIAVVLSTFARLDPTGDAARIHAAFAAGAAQLPSLRGQLALRSAVASGLGDLDTALDRLAASSPAIQSGVLRAAAQVIATDDTVTVEEGELYRATAAALGCPAPLLPAA